MTPRRRFILALFVIHCFSLPAVRADTLADVRPPLAKYCFGCHGERKAQGKLNLEALQDEAAILRVPAIWHEVGERLRRHEMPPRDQSQPTPAEARQLTDWAAAVLARIDAATPPHPGRVTLRRLNRREYANTIRDLVGVNFDFTFDPTRDFPADGAGYGFDNIGDVLTTSPLLLEKYLAAAGQILDRALVVDAIDGPRTWKFAASELRQTAPGPALAPTRWITELDIRQPGEYLVRVVLHADVDSKTLAQMTIQADGVNPERFTYARQRQRTSVERKLKLTRGRLQVWTAYEREQDKKAFEPADAANGRIIVESIEIVGPLNIKADQLPASHRRIVIRRPGADQSRRQTADEVLTEFARRAFRRPVVAAEVARYVALFEKADRDGASFEEALRLPLQAFLVSPHFLFRVEQDRPTRAGSYALNGFELASRLSYFLWSTMPDEELFRAAAAGKLTDSTELTAQARRMLRDPRAAALAENFVSQWLQIRGLEHFQPDARQAGKLGTDLRNAMMQEPILVFQEILREDRAIGALLDADFTYANAPLARHYGLPIAAENQGKETDARRMVRYVLPDGRRGGVLTMAAVLAVTSHPDRTSPVRRGKWVLEALLGAPPPPPPADVGELPTDAKTLATQTLRQRLETHRANAACATCHQRMDPLGFAFENYDVLGRWRDRDGKLAIDTAATLPDGRSFKGPVELKKLLLGQKPEFTRCLTEKLLTYALGRGLEPTDRRTVTHIAAAVAADNDRLSRLIVEIVLSDAFRQRALAQSKN